ncbi:MAG TPA: hypothetical protein VIX20_11025, partial [Ktedonobacteraceae bacterium]
LFPQAQLPAKPWSHESARPMLPFFRCKTCVQMLRFHSGEELESWILAAFHSTIPELRSFVHKLCQDQAAVQAGLTLKWKNGMVEGEGHLHRLQFLKRSMSGRTNFDLLRLRVLHHRTCA